MKKARFYLLLFLFIILLWAIGIYFLGWYIFIPVGLFILWIWYEVKQADKDFNNKCRKNYDDV